MVAIGTLWSILGQWSPLGGITPQLPNERHLELGAAPSDAAAAIPGLQLTHVVKDRFTFSLHDEARLRASEDVGPDLNVRAKRQAVPRFAHHASAADVEHSWRLAVERHHGYATPFADSGAAVDRSDPRQWALADVAVPDVVDKETVLTLAKLAANAYVPTPFEGDWSEVNGTDGWNHEGTGYGWDDDSLRGYVFTSADRSLAVLSIKGTSTAVWDSGGPTAPNDKINDNLFFSCCCARVTRLWNTVCDCYTGHNTCDEACLETELWREDRYYREVLDLYEDVRGLVPDIADLWVVGHSLGGALSSMLGRTYGLPVVTFEAPGEDLPVHRLHLPVPPGLPPWDDHVWHFGHNADPIFMGTCSGGSSTCSVKGFAMETRCHSGQVCMYDVKADLGWHESIVNHRIHVVIDNVLEVYDAPAVCVTPEYCEDCYDWEFIDPYEDASSSQASVPTSTTSKSTTTTTIKTKPTGITTTPPTPTTTRTRKAHTTPLTTSCVSRGWTGRCQEWTTMPAEPAEPTSSCVEHNWYGGCDQWTSLAKA